MGINEELVRDLTDKEIEHIKKRVRSKSYPTDMSIEESEELREYIQKILTKSFLKAKRECVKAKKLKTRKALLEIIMFLEDELGDESQDQILVLEDKIKELKSKLAKAETKLRESADSADSYSNTNTGILKELEEKSNECTRLLAENNGLRLYVEKLEDKIDDRNHNASDSITYVNSPSMNGKSDNLVALPLQITDVDGLHEKLIEMDLNHEMISMAVQKMEKQMQMAFHNYIKSFGPSTILESNDFQIETNE